MERQRQAIPSGIEIIPLSDGLAIRRRWYTWRAIPVALFVLAWDSLLIFGFLALSGFDVNTWILLALALFHTVVGVGMTYFAIASFVNRTDVVINANAVVVRTEPLKWIHDKVTSVKTMSRVDIRSYKNLLGCVVYAVEYANREGAWMCVIGGLREFTDARFLKETLEDLLALKPFEPKRVVQ